MNVTLTKNGTELIAAIEGRLDTLTAPDLEDQLESALDGIEKLVFDLAELTYISSAGLRVFLCIMQIMEDQGEMILRNVRTDVMDVLEITGFADSMNIE